jgi:hypothetical protein
MSIAVDEYGTNKLARARARIAVEVATAVIPLLEPGFPYTVMTPPIDYFKKFIKQEPPTEDLPPQGW